MCLMTVLWGIQGWAVVGTAIAPLRYSISCSAASCWALSRCLAWRGVGPVTELRATAAAVSVLKIFYSTLLMWESVLAPEVRRPHS